MPANKRGGRRPGAGRKKTLGHTLRDAIDSIDCDRIFTQLDEWSKGKPVVCPHCFKDTGARTADTVALQSALELLNRRLGKSVQQVSIDITEQIVLSADQIDTILQRYEIASKAIEGEVKLIEATASQMIPFTKGDD